MSDSVAFGWLMFTCIKCVSSGLSHEGDSVVDSSVGSFDSVSVSVGSMVVVSGGVGPVVVSSVVIGSVVVSSVVEPSVVDSVVSFVVGCIVVLSAEERLSCVCEDN